MGLALYLAVRPDADSGLRLLGGDARNASQSLRVVDDRPAWMTWLAMTAVYLGAFLSGIRPAAWFGTRLAPLAASLIPLVVIALLSVTIAASLWVLGLLVVAAFDVLLVVLILFVVQTRDFA